MTRTIPAETNLAMPAAHASPTMRTTTRQRSPRIRPSSARQRRLSPPQDDQNGLGSVGYQFTVCRGIGIMLVKQVQLSLSAQFHGPQQLTGRLLVDLQQRPSQIGIGLSQQNEGKLSRSVRRPSIDVYHCGISSFLRVSEWKSIFRL
jgi:hypothetical protein